MVADIVVVLRTIVAIDIVGIIIDIVGIVVVLDIVGTVVVGFRTLVIEVFAILAVDTVGIAILVVVIQVAGIEGIIAQVVDIVVVMARIVVVVVVVHIAIGRFVSVPSFVGGGFALSPSQSYQMHEIWPRSSICFGWILYLCLKRSVEHVPWRDLIIWSGCLVGGF